MTKTYYGFGQKEKPALLEFGPEPLGTYYRRPRDLRSDIESITVQQS